MQPNRIVTALLFAFGLGAAILPAAANMDWTSVAGVLGGAGVICAGGVTWLLGWQKHEARAGSEPDVDTTGVADRTPQHEHAELAG